MVQICAIRRLRVKFDFGLAHYASEPFNYINSFPAMGL